MFTLLLALNHHMAIHKIMRASDWSFKFNAKFSISIKYLTYLVLNKRKLDNKQAHVDPVIGGPTFPSYY